MNVYGWDIQQSGIHPSLFSIISVANDPDNAVPIPPELAFTAVIGKTVSSSISNSNNWESSLEANGIESNFSISSALLQTGEMEKLWTDKPEFSGRTLVNIAQSTQVWRGVEPLSISLTLEFVAFRNAYLEVEAPIQMLYLMQAPNLRKGVAKTIAGKAKDLTTGANKEDIKNAMGEVPRALNLSITSKRFNAIYVLESISEDEDEVKRDRFGNRIRQQVNLSFKSKRAIIRGENSTILV